MVTKEPILVQTEKQRAVEDAKKRAAEKGVEFVQDGMVVGLGTGSTAAYFIRALAKEQKRIVTVASSSASEELARSLGLSVVSIDAISGIDLTCDGADEVDPNKQMIKGAGGALLHEKIVARASRALVILVDETKCVARLGHTKLPVEIVSFGYLLTLHTLAAFGTPHLRLREVSRPFVTDSGNFICDLELPKPLATPEALDAAIHTIPGVIESGLFLNLNPTVIVGNLDGSCEIR